jgi:hypothetical protein
MKFKRKLVLVHTDPIYPVLKICDEEQHIRLLMTKVIKIDACMVFFLTQVIGNGFHEAVGF